MPIRSPIRSVCVFCSASNAVAPFYREEARRFGTMLAERGMELVFGGGDCGLMGAVASGILAAGGKATGVFPEVLRGLEPDHAGVTEMILVPDMHTRKQIMFYRADAFVILPGGFGTMDETFEVITWKQLHTHNKPIIFYNQRGYWDPWLTLTKHFIREGFAGIHTESLYDVETSLEAVCARLEGEVR